MLYRLATTCADSTVLTLTLLKIHQEQLQRSASPIAAPWALKALELVKDIVIDLTLQIGLSIFAFSTVRQTINTCPIAPVFPLASILTMEILSISHVISSVLLTISAETIHACVILVVLPALMPIQPLEFV